MVVMPSMVMETSLTMDLLEPPPPPEPELPSADCEDEAADVSDVAAVDDVDEATEDEFVAVGWDVEAVTAALDDAIALIDMKASLAENHGHYADRPPGSPFNAAGDRSRRRRCEKAPMQRTFPLPGQQPITRPRVATSSRLSGEAARGRHRRSPAMDGQSSRLTSV